MNVTEAAEEITFDRYGAAGVVTLQRPRALNALTLDMVRRLDAALVRWENDPQIRCVAIRSGSERAFCAGGDIRALYELGKAGRYDEALAFWREEYALNCRIKRYSKPYVALIDGIVMGGGVGISLHGSHRVAGPSYAFAMPEVGIGFFPDVGATWALPRLPGHAGSWLALTGARILADDACVLGLATHRVAEGSFQSILDALADGYPVDGAIAPWSIEPRAGTLNVEMATIRACFGRETVSEILEALDEAARNSAFALAAASALRANSPTSVLIAHEQMRRGESLDFLQAMQTEFRIVSRLVRQHDFYEGVRAMIIDKDRQPAWSPVDLASTERSVIAGYFEPLADGEFNPDARGRA